MRKISEIIVHCSDSPDPLDVGVEEIRRWHLSRGWSDIGYNYVVRRDGRVEQGRPEHQAGSHAYGHNARSIGICWVGRDNCTPVIREALIEKIIDLCFKYYLSPQNVLGHCELTTRKTCPNLNMDELREDIANELSKKIVEDE